MAPLIHHVEPGDLIKAGDWNSVLDELVALEVRLATLEAFLGSAKAPHIAGRIPIDDVEAPGSLTLLGTNFAVPSRGNTVFFDGVDLLARPGGISPFLSGSSDKMLIFDLPALADLPRTFSIRVSNSAGTSNAIDVLVKQPDVVIRGTMVIDKTPQNLERVDAGTTFLYKLTTFSNEDVRFSLTPMFSNVKGSTIAAWKAGATRIVDADGNVLREVLVKSGQAKTIGVQIAPPKGARSVDIAFHAKAENSTDVRLSDNSPASKIVIGQPYKDNENAPTFRVVDHGIEVAQVTLDDLRQVLLFKPGKQDQQVKLAAKFVVAGVYEYTAEIDPPSTIWKFHDPGQPVNPDRAPETPDVGDNLIVALDNNATGATSQKWTVNVTATRLSGDDEIGRVQTTYSFLIGIS